MNELISFALSVFTSFFAIINPVSITPLFLSLTDGKSSKSRKSIAMFACVTAFMIVLAVVLFGKYIFLLFGISLPAFKITGGILLFYVGFEMLLSKKSAVHSPDDKNDEEEAHNIAISPLATPILAGPGTIVTAMNLATDAGFVKLCILILIIGAMILATYYTFILGDKVITFFGQNIIAVIGKLTGLILAIIGTGMLIEGIKLSFNLI